MSRTAPAESAWYVQIADRVWGPYPDARMAAFVAEGRIAARSLVGRGPQGPFVSAAHQPGLRALFGQDHEERSVFEGRPGRPLLVWADLATSDVDRLKALLAAQGPSTTVQPGLWLVLAHHSAAELRNELTRRLGASDRLMVVEASASQVAWFNLGEEADRRLRRLWAEADLAG